MMGSTDVTASAAISYEHEAPAPDRRSAFYKTTDLLVV